jgi:hypothetical protein
MKKSDWQYLIDTLLFICIFGITFIGILMAFFLPKGPSALESDKYFLGLHRHQWGDIHLYISLAFVFLVIIHLTLSWTWIKGKAKTLFNKGWRILLTLTVISAFLVLMLFWAFTPKNSQKYAEYGVRSGKASERPLALEELMDRDRGVVTITGKLTLEEVGHLTGVPPGDLVDSLGLPSKTPHDETLGQLRKKYGFDMIEFREVLTDLMNRSHPEQEARQPSGEAIPQKREMSEKEIPQRKHALHEEEHEKKMTRGRLAEDTSGILITGRMTLRELGEQTGLSGRAIADKLGLPASVSLDEHLGRLRRRYGFLMQDLRDVIDAMLEE